jgi:CHAT domain-containing protein
LLGPATRLLIAPDGALNLIPFEALVDEQHRYAVQQFAISYLTSGRDLLRLQVPRASQRAPLIVANPSFGPAALVTARTRRHSVTTGPDLSVVYFAPLPGTAAEAHAVKTVFPIATVLTGGDATKTALTHVDAPALLHIATHGFFLRNASTTPDEAPSGTRAIAASTRIENPLLRSGLALSGANLRTRGGGDGILTALEASTLNLWGTHLVTLSGCDTGVGDVRNGEGVYGLRRAFLLAGAETLVMSLWPVSDDVTRDMMTAYYAGLQRGLGRGDALRRAQLAMLKQAEYRHPFYWASFIQAGDWRPFPRTHPTR